MMMTLLMLMRIMLVLLLLLLPAGQDVQARRNCMHVSWKRLSPRSQ
jgi:hypothetical protein